MLALGHPSLVQNVISDDTSLILSGMDASMFNGTWRSADNSMNLEISSDSIQTIGSSFVRTDADVDIHPVDVAIHDSSFHIAITTKLPRIESIRGRDGALTYITCGDSIFIDIIFSEPVEVTVGHHLKLLFSNGEIANYVDGNLTNKLGFVYHVADPDESIGTSLMVAGPSALEFNSTDFPIRKKGSSQIFANVTVPSPFQVLAFQDDSYSAITLSCAAAGRVESIEMYSTSTLYSAGDVFDIIVTTSLFHVNV